MTNPSVPPPITCAASGASIKPAGGSYSIFFDVTSFQLSRRGLSSVLFGSSQSAATTSIGLPVYDKRTLSQNIPSLSQRGWITLIQGRFGEPK